MGDRGRSEWAASRPRLLAVAAEWRRLFWPLSREHGRDGEGRSLRPAAEARGPGKRGVREGRSAAGPAKLGVREAKAGWLSGRRRSSEAPKLGPGPQAV